MKRKDFSELKDCVSTILRNHGVILIPALHGLARYAHSSATCRIINKQGAYRLSKGAYTVVNMEIWISRFRFLHDTDQGRRKINRSGHCENRKCRGSPGEGAGGGHPPAQQGGMGER